MPFSYSFEKNQSNLIVNILEDEIACFNTKERVPYLVTVECVDPFELLRFLKSRVKNKETLDPFFETDPQSKSRRSLTSKEKILLEEFPMTGEFENLEGIIQEIMVEKMHKRRKYQREMSSFMKTCFEGKSGDWSELRANRTPAPKKPVQAETKRADQAASYNRSMPNPGKLGKKVRPVATPPKSKKRRSVSNKRRGRRTAHKREGKMGEGTVKRIQEVVEALLAGPRLHTNSSYSFNYSKKNGRTVTIRNQEASACLLKLEKQVESNSHKTKSFLVLKLGEKCAREDVYRSPELGKFVQSGDSDHRFSDPIGGSSSGNEKEILISKLESGTEKNSQFRVVRVLR